MSFLGQERHFDIYYRNKCILITLVVLFKLDDRKWNVFPSDGHNLICKARSCAQREGEIERHLRVEKTHIIPLYCVEEKIKRKQDEKNAYIHVIHV